MSLYPCLGDEEYDDDDYKIKRILIIFICHVVIKNYSDSNNPWTRLVYVTFKTITWYFFCI